MKRFVLVLVLAGILLGLQRTAEAKLSAEYRREGVYLTWAEPEKRLGGQRLHSSEIAGYNIYRHTAQDGDYERINNQVIKALQFFDTSIEWGKSYYYSLTTIDQSGLEGPFSKKIEAYAPLSPPFNLKAVGRKGCVILSWDKSNNPKIRGYNIYRSFESGSGYAKVASVLDNEYEYSDREVVVGKNYYYLATTVDVSWQESGYGEEVAASPVFVTEEEWADLEKVDGLSAAVEEGAVVLRWKPVQVDNLAGYNIYRRSGDSQAQDSHEQDSQVILDYQRINRGLLKEPGFTDKGVEPRQGYYYCIAAVDEDGHEARFPREIYVMVASLYINSLTLDSTGRPLKGGDILTIALNGTPGKKALAWLGSHLVANLGEGANLDNKSNNINALTEKIQLKESDQPGFYYGECLIPLDINQTGVSVIGRLENENGESSEYVLREKIRIDNLPPGQVPDIEAEVSQDMVCLHWKYSDSSDSMANNNISIANNIAIDMDMDSIEIYRSKEPQPEITRRGSSGRVNGDLVSERILAAESSWCDKDIQPRQRYFYSIAIYDQAGNRTVVGDYLSVETLADTIAPKIHSVAEVSQPGVKGIGGVISIKMKAESGAKGRFLIGQGIEQGFKETEAGHYLGEYTIKSGDDVSSEPLVVEVTDASGNQSRWQGDIKISINTQKNSLSQPVISSVEHNAFQIGGFLPLVAGDKIQLMVKGDPGCTAYINLGVQVGEDQLSEDQVGEDEDIAHGEQGQLAFYWDKEQIRSKVGEDIISYSVYRGDKPYAKVEDAKLVEKLPPAVSQYILKHNDQNKGRFIAISAEKRSGFGEIILTPRLYIPLTEINPGVYEGSYEIQAGDYLMDESVTGYLVNQQGQGSTPLAANERITIDTGVKISVTPNKKSMKADSQSKNEIEVKVTDARGIGVSGRQIEMELFTTIDEYSGIVGVGRFEEDEAGYLDYFAEMLTDPWGVVTIPYMAGFAAKTVIIRAKDILGHGVGLGYITSYVEEEININLVESGNRQRFHNLEFSLDLSSDRDWLTADGVSRARIYAKVTDAEGKPVAGHDIFFSLDGENGHLQGTQNITDKAGIASCIYVAGKHISPQPVITAIDKNADGGAKNLCLTLRSDAPAKMTITVADGSAGTLTANGMSSCELIIKVEDVNANPIKQLPLDAKIIKGSGRLEPLDMNNSFGGEYKLIYRSGTEPGLVTIRVRAMSVVPNQEILDKIRVMESTL